MNEGLKTCGKPSRGRYVQGCRCYMCRVANADYGREQYYSKHSQTSAMVDRKATARARARVQAWLDEGYSLRGICRSTGVSRSAMRTLVTGEHHNAPRRKDGRPYKSARMSRENYRKIMRCENPGEPTPDTLVDARALNDALAWLYAHGVTPAQVSRASGIPAGTIYRLGGNAKCKYKTLARLTAAARELKEGATA